MALGSRSRSVIFETLTNITGDQEAVEELLANYAAREIDEPASKAYLDTRLRALEADLKGETSKLRREGTGELSGLRREFAVAHEKLHSDLVGDINDLRDDMQRLAIWMIGAVFTLMVALIAAQVYLGTR